MASGMVVSKNNGCGVVMKGVDREEWVTITRTEVFLEVSAAMAAETVGVFTGVLDLIFCKNFFECTKHQSTNQSDLAHCVCSMDKRVCDSISQNLCARCTFRSFPGDMTALSFVACTGIQKG